MCMEELMTAAEIMERCAEADEIVREWLDKLTDFLIEQARSLVEQK